MNLSISTEFVNYGGWITSALADVTVESMEDIRKNNDDISVYIEDREFIVNTYVLKSFSVTMIIYTIAFILNLLNIFVIEKSIMASGYIPSLLIYCIVYLMSKKISLSDEKTKYFVLLGIMAVVTIMGVTITYHVVLVSILPILYATLYSSKPTMKYVYFLTVVSTFVIVYGGYFFGLCDANMVLITCKRVQDYVVDGRFILTEVDKNPYVSLGLFYVLPRCLIYIAFVSICSNIFKIVSGSLEKAKLTVELERAKEEAEAASRAKSQFLARMSHEIRTPINAVLGMNEMILQESKEEEIQKYASDIHNSANTLLYIINEILDSSKIESGKMEIVAGNYAMGSLLNDLYNMVSIKAKEKGLALTFDIDKSIPGEYFGDDKRIRQIVLNLLSNAVKYTKQGSVTLSVTGKAEGENAILRFSVKDTGIGIREEDLGKIYDAFQRIDESKNRYVEGTGLGLNIARQFLLLMGSDLQITSEYGKGSEFSFELAQKVVSTTPVGDFRGKLIQASETKIERIDFKAPKAKILVVDDNKMNLKVFGGLLKHTQIQVYEAENGKECLNLLKTQKYDLVFIDHMMPEMDGIETLHEIKKNRLCEGTPVIMLTANAIVGEKEKYLKEGFDDFLTKPIMPERLDTMILRYLPKELVEIDKETDELPGIDMATGIANTGSEELYYSLLGDFCLMIDMKVDKIKTCIEEKKFKDYTIEVHALKSSARLVGMKELGEKFYRLEQLGDKEQEDLIIEETPAVLEELKKYKPILEKFIEKEESDKLDMDVETVSALLQDMTDAVDGFDMDQADAIMKRLEQYQFPDKCLEQFEQLRICVADVAMEQIMDICKNLIDELNEKNTD